MRLDLPFNPDRQVALWVPILASVVILGVDLLTPSQVQMSIFFILPVLFTAWYNGLIWSIIFSISLPSARFLIASFLEPLWPVEYNILNAINRMIVLCIISLITAKLSTLVKRVKVLEGLISMCAWCKKIQNENQEWQPLEEYVSDHSNTDFTHGICPECEKLMREGRLERPQG